MRRVTRRSSPTARACAARSLVLFVALAVMFATPAPASSPELEPVCVVYGSAPGDEFDLPLGVAIDARRREVLIADTGHHRIEIYDFQGRSRGRYTHYVSAADGARSEGRPAKLAIDASGRTLVVDQRASYVDVLDLRGRSVARLDCADTSAGSSAGAVAVTAAGEILVAAGRDGERICRFSRNYAPIGCWGEAGKDSGQLAGITGIATLSDDRVVVVCASTRYAVQIFEPDGRFVRGFGVHDVGGGNFSFPSGLAVTADDRIWVSDELRQIVQVFDSAGQFLGMMGGQGVRPGEFLYPSALASDGEAHLAVSERVGGRLQLLRVR